MDTPTPEPQQQFEERTARLRAQLDAKSSLFDILSPPPPRKVEDAAAEDAKLQKVIRSVSRSNILMLCFVGMFLLFEILDRSSRTGMTYYIVILVLVSALGGSVVAALRLLHTRVVALEAE